MKKNNLSLDVAAISQITAAFGFQLLEVTSHRKVWRLKTNLGYKHLKCIPSFLTSDDLWFIYEALNHLTQQSFENIPKLYLTKDRSPFYLWDNKYYLLTDWHFSKELDFRNAHDLSAATRLLADFHYKSRGFEPSNSNYRTFWYNWPQKLKTRIKQLEDFYEIAHSQKKECPFSRLYLQYFDDFYFQATISLRALLNSPYQKIASIDAAHRSFCHHDYSDRNILRTPQNKLFLTDFDYCLRDLRIHDLINLLIHNLKHRQFDSGLAQVILADYHQVSPLSKAEMEVMYILLCWPQDFWQIGLQYYDEKLPWPRERFLRKLENKIKIRLKREFFLTEFPQQNGIYHFCDPVF